MACHCSAVQPSFNHDQRDCKKRKNLNNGVPLAKFSVHASLSTCWNNPLIAKNGVSQVGHSKLKLLSSLV